MYPISIGYRQHQFSIQRIRPTTRLLVPTKLSCCQFSTNPRTIPWRYAGLRIWTIWRISTVLYGVRHTPHIIFVPNLVKSTKLENINVFFLQYGLASSHSRCHLARYSKSTPNSRYPAADNSTCSYAAATWNRFPHSTISSMYKFL